MSASTLRAAAALIRARVDGISGTLYWKAPHEAPGDSAYIASWSPEVALAVADLIDTVAKVGPVDGGAEWDATVNLARTYLGVTE